MLFYKFNVSGFKQFEAGLRIEDAGCGCVEQFGQDDFHEVPYFYACAYAAGDGAFFSAACHVEVQ